MNILLTRSIEENRNLEKIFSTRNIKCISLPIIQYMPLAIDYEQILKKKTNVIITSKYAARIIAKNINQCFNLNAWVVGRNSANILKHARFNVHYIANNVNDLINHVPPNIYQNSIYLSANEVTKEMPKQICRKIIYKVQYLNALNANQLETLQSTTIHYILIYSQNTAKALIKLLQKYELIELLKHAKIITISLKVAEMLSEFFTNVIYSDNLLHNNIDMLISDLNDEYKRFKENN